jgi:hypothetical protein
MSTITSNPPGARVYLREQYVGTTPVTVKLDDGFLDNSRYNIRIAMDGYREQALVLQQEWSAGGIVLDALLFFPTLGIMGYVCALNCQRHRDSYSFILEPVPPMMAPPMQPPPPYWVPPQRVPPPIQPRPFEGQPGARN